MNVRLTIKPNSRQIPSSKQYMSNAKYCDLLYGYLQSISHRDPSKNNCRFIRKEEVNFTTIAYDLGMTRQTVSKKFKSMLQDQKDSISLLRYVPEEKKYYLIDLDRSVATLVQHNTLQILISCLQVRVISIYVYLLNRYIASGYNEFIYTMEELKKVVGLGYKSTGNNYIINSALYVLKKLGLLDYRYQQDKKADGQERTRCYITWMTNELQNLPEDLNDEKIQATYKLLKTRVI